MQNIFSCTHCSLYIFSREMSIQIICQFLNCFSSCWVVVLYILWINNPYQIWFIGFPHFTGCVFNMSSDVPTFFYELQLFFLSCAFGVISKNHCQTQYHVAFPVFLSKSFILAFMFVSLIWVHFVQRKAGVQFHYFACVYTIFPIPFVENTVLTPLVLVLFSKIISPYMCSFIWDPF